MVTEGKLTATVVMPPSSGRAVDEIAATLAGKPRPPALITLSPSGFPEPHRLRDIASLRPGPKPTPPASPLPRRKERIA
jgi:hypothetical protein